MKRQLVANEDLLMDKLRDKITSRQYALIGFSFPSLEKLPEGIYRETLFGLELSLGAVSGNDLAENLEKTLFFEVSPNTPKGQSG